MLLNLFSLVIAIFVALYLLTEIISTNAEGFVEVGN
jgi:hypothetical protein